jgi:hypothetical protein
MRFNLDGRIGALRGQGCLRSYQRRHLHQVGNQTGPPGLMTRAQSRSILTVKILMELDQIFPVRIVLKLLDAPVHRAFSVLLAKEDIGQPSIDLDRNLEQRDLIARTRRALDFKVVSVKLIKLISARKIRPLTGIQIGPRQLELPPNIPVFDSAGRYSTELLPPAYSKTNGFPS